MGWFDREEFPPRAYDARPVFDYDYQEAEWLIARAEARADARAARLQAKWTETVERRAMAKKGSRKGGKKC